MQFVGDLSQDFFASSHSLVEDADADKTALINIGIDRARGNQVINGNAVTCLPIAVETPDPLFDAHRIPGEVIVDQAITELVVETFTSYLRRKQYIKGCSIFFGTAKVLS